MEVTFGNSGAINRAHYALVQKVETATDPGLADAAIIREIDNIRAQFTKGTFSPDSTQCRDALLILLYCTTALTYGLPRPDYMEFALPAAAGLAEGGSRHSDRRDLESHDESRICMALDMLVQGPTPDVIPAIENRLEELLSHKSFHVKRRALAAFRVLSQHDQELLQRTMRKIHKRLRDDVVPEVALSLAVDLVKADILSAETVIPPIVDLIGRTPSKRDHRRQPCLLRAIKSLGELAGYASTEEVPHLANILLQNCKPSQPYTVILEVFRALRHVPEQVLEAVLSAASTSHPISAIRPWLSSKDRNLQYALLACLLALDVRLWAGTEEKIPPQLQEAEVHRIMSLLDSNDPTIRLMTSRLLHRVDPNILEVYLTRYIASIPCPTKHSLAVCESYASRALEVSGILDEEGPAYANRILQLLQAIQTPHQGEAPDSKVKSNHDPVASDAAKQAGWGAGVKSVLESVVEVILDRLRSLSDDFRTTFTETICEGVFSDSSPTRGPTSRVICAAVTCEYGHLIASLEPQAVLQGLTSCLQGANAGVKEAILISMVRAAARCETILDDVKSAVVSLSKSSGRHIRNRCDQFLLLIKELDRLKETLSDMKSSTLPDVLVAVEEHLSKQPKSPPRAVNSLPMSSPKGSPRNSPSLSPQQLSPRPSSKLRYEAYEPPSVPNAGNTSRRNRKPSYTPSSSAASEYRGRSPEFHSFDLDPMSQTITAGFLALAGGDEDLRSVSHSKPSSPRPRLPTSILTPLDSVTSRMDLIALESPFHTEPPSGSDNKSSAASSPLVYKDDNFMQRFEEAWAALMTTKRGWHESSPTNVARLLQDAGLGFVIALPETDVFGDPAVVHDVVGLIPSATGQAQTAVRLRPGEDDSCLWVLKCDDAGLRAAIGGVLQRS
ncbi:hypothetical protein FRB99_003072 [Tulasnella sp. 403]|nr:hypothetical protein FRB99_003072 [Tulasnella sp. 403]